MHYCLLDLEICELISPSRKRLLFYDQGEQKWEMRDDSTIAGRPEVSSLAQDRTAKRSQKDFKYYLAKWGLSPSYLI